MKKKGEKKSSFQKIENHKNLRPQNFAKKFNFEKIKKRIGVLYDIFGKLNKIKNITNFEKCQKRVFFSF